MKDLQGFIAFGVVFQKIYKIYMVFRSVFGDSSWFLEEDFVV